MSINNIRLVKVFMRIFLSLLFFVYSSNLYAFNKSCALPEEIELGYKANSSSNNNKIETNSKPRVYYNFPESNMGFVVEKLENPSTLDYNYRSVSTWIDTIIGEIFDEPIEYSFFRGSDFDYQLRSYTYSEFKNNVSNPDFYSCKGNIECQKFKTGLSDLARDIKSQGFTEGDHFTVIVSDLFIDEQEIGGNDSSIQKLFESTFANNKSIGIYGIKSKFNGNMYNIPNTQFYDKAVSRPFFVIAIGEKNSVLKFKNLLDRDALKKVSSEDKNFTIFTSDLILNPVTPSNISEDIFITNKKIVHGIEDLKSLFPQLKKFTIPRRNNDPINIQFNLSDIQLPDTIFLQNLEIQTTVWKHKENKCWIRLKNDDMVFKWSQVKNLINLELLGEEKLKKLKPKEIYLFNFKIYANDLGVSEEDFWMSEWNLNDSDINKVTTSGEQDFPVLNLLKLFRKLDDIQTDEFKRPDRERALPIEFNIAVELKR